MRDQMRPASAVQQARVQTRIGDLSVRWDGQGLLAIQTADPLSKHSEFFSFPRFVTDLGNSIDSYLDGELRAFKVPISPALLGTPFEREVWKALSFIPFGQTVSYAELAGAIGRRSAVRAVANAVGRNPLPMIIPCHRVIRSDGTLGGYSFAHGTSLKAQLIQVERSNCSDSTILQY